MNLYGIVGTIIKLKCRLVASFVYIIICMKKLSVHKRVKPLKDVEMQFSKFSNHQPEGEIFKFFNPKTLMLRNAPTTNDISEKFEST